MKVYKISDMIRGWFIGDFTPSIFRTPLFEVGLLHHKAGEVWPKHIHKVATEYNLLVSGSMTMGNNLIEPGTIFVVEPGEVAEPTFLRDCTIVVVKVPSVPGDKYGVD